MDREYNDASPSQSGTTTTLSTDLGLLGAAREPDRCWSLQSADSGAGEVLLDGIAQHVRTPSA